MDGPLAVSNAVVTALVQPLLLTESPTVVGSHLTTFLRGAGSKGIDSDGSPVFPLTILGGALAVSTAVVSSMESDL